ncbi:MAG: glycosyltransferase family 4 protein [Deltaproteobacteria bacterium]|nr:glycosyltransferase family 4 protein [Deltaproteobacteria bacterium]
MDVSIVTASQISPEYIEDELECYALSNIPINTVNEYDFDRQKKRVKGISIRTLNDLDLRLWLSEIQSERTIGYTFYLGTPLSARDRDAAGSLDLIVAGSSFCEERLKQVGLTNTKTVIQGIDPGIYNPHHAAKSRLQDRFIIFSGGKLEYRKGQDIVLKAFKAFSEKHSDALLVNAWFNQWEFSLKTMLESRLIEFCFDAGNFMKSMVDLIRMNHIDPEKVITLPLKTPHQLANIFRNTDIGLFPNRCEGGTNLMLMEYMACGKPVIATSKTGHSDIIEPENPFAVKHYESVHPRSNRFSEYEEWVEPNVDEIIALLETAYNHPEQCLQEGIKAGKRLANMTWEKAAGSFHEISRDLIS